MSAEWSPEKGDAGATIKGSVSGSLFTGTVKSKNGLNSQVEKSKLEMQPYREKEKHSYSKMANFHRRFLPKYQEKYRQ